MRVDDEDHREYLTNLIRSARRSLQEALLALGDLVEELERGTQDCEFVLGVIERLEREHELLNPEDE